MARLIGFEPTTPSSGGWCSNPAELQARSLKPRHGRGEWIRTTDPLLPKQMRYQAALRPVEGLRAWIVADLPREAQGSVAAGRVRATRRGPGSAAASNAGMAPRGASGGAAEAAAVSVEEGARVSGGPVGIVVGGVVIEGSVGAVVAVPVGPGVIIRRVAGSVVGHAVARRHPIVLAGALVVPFLLLLLALLRGGD